MRVCLNRFRLEDFVFALLVRSTFVTRLKFAVSWKARRPDLRRNGSSAWRNLDESSDCFRERCSRTQYHRKHSHDSWTQIGRFTAKCGAWRRVRLCSVSWSTRARFHSPHRKRWYSVLRITSRVRHTWRLSNIVQSLKPLRIVKAHVQKRLRVNIPGLPVAISKLLSEKRRGPVVCPGQRSSRAKSQNN